MSIAIIPNKLDRLIQHLNEGGSEEDAPRVLKIRETETIQAYLVAAKEKLADPGKKAPAKKQAKKPAKKEAPAEVVEEEVVDEEDDEFDDEFDEDEDWDTKEPASEKVVEEEVVEEVVEEAPAPEPPVPDTPAPKTPAATTGVFEDILLDDNNLQQPLTLVSQKNGKRFFKIQRDEEIEITIGRKRVKVLRDKTLAETASAITLADGGVYPTEFVKAAVNLAIM